MSSLLLSKSFFAKVCDTCKDAHNDILKREISRVNNQIKRGMNRIEDALEVMVEAGQAQRMTDEEARRRLRKLRPGAGPGCSGHRNSHLRLLLRHSMSEV